MISPDIRRLFVCLSATWAIVSGVACVGAVDATGETTPVVPANTEKTAKPGDGNPVGMPGTNVPGAMVGSTGTPDKPGGAATVPVGPAALDAPAPMPLRRLTRDELGNTLRDLLGDTSGVAKALPSDGRGAHGFLEAGTVSTVDAESLIKLVDAVAAGVAKRMVALVACDPAKSGEETCIKQLVTQFGRRAFRRPVTDPETQRFIEYFRSIKTELAYSFADNTRVVLQAMLLSPGFLYHWELGAQAATAQAGGRIKLNPHEIASRLSYFLWGSMPDDTLFAAVDTGKFTTDADVEREVRRMLTSEKARATVAVFHAQWLQLEKLIDAQKDAKAYPEWSADLAAAMVSETTEFATRTLFDGAGTLGALLTSNNSFVNAALARVYKITGPTARELVPATLPAAERAGLFTLAGFLSVHATATGSHPVKRGHKIFEDVLCGIISSPPDMVPPAGVPPTNVSTRELFEAHAKNACAVACHALIDPPGFAFEHYDAIGRYRTTDGGKPVNAAGMLRLPSGDGMPFQNAVEFSRGLAKLPDVESCFARQWFRFALARREGDGDAAALQDILTSFRKSGGNARELLVAIAKSRAFSTRAAAMGEVLR